MLPQSPTRLDRSRMFFAAALALIGISVLAMRADLAWAEPETPYAVSIYAKGTTDAYDHSLTGQYRQMCVYAGAATGPPVYASQFDFLVCNDEEIITFVRADIGDGLPAAWEYFSYRTDTIGTLCGTCPSNSVRLRGIASLGSGGSPAGLPLAGCIAELTYHVSLDCNYTGICSYVEFCGLDCGDNVVTSGNGDSLYLPLSGIVPGPAYDPVACLTPGGGGQTPVACVDYAYGAICSEDWCESGDINLNGIVNEIGDAVLYGNYFVYGPSVWDPYYSEVQIFSSDINNDGKTLTIADLVYLTYVIAGTAPPYPSANPTARTPISVELQSAISDGMLHVQMSSAIGIDGVHLVYRYAGCRPGEPVASVPPGLVMGSSARNGELRIAIYPDLQNPGSGYEPGESEIVTLPIAGHGEMKLVEAQFSDPDGQALEAKVTSSGIPDRFALNQNFPNPFNAATVIPYSLRDDAWVTLEIIDVLGRTVARPVDQFQSAGTHEYEWRGIDAEGNTVASGMYFYRLAVGDRVMTRKMVLLK